MTEQQNSAYKLHKSFGIGKIFQQKFGLVPEERLLDPGGLPRVPQPEEGVVLHRTLPQVLAATLTVQPANQ